jgi:hypothetical protein
MERPFVDEADISIMPGERVLIAGESGTGKSTLVGAIAGLWPWGEGKIEMRGGAKVFFLPQRPYMPIGSLRRAVTYPDPAESRTSREIADVLHDVGLEHPVERLDEEGSWSRPCQVVKSSALLSRACFFRDRTSLFWMKQRQHSILKARTGSWKNLLKGRLGRHSSASDIARNWNLIMIAKSRWSGGAAALGSVVMSVLCPNPA